MPNKQHKKKTLLRLFTKTEQSSDTVTTQEPSREVTPSCKWFQSTTELPLRNFIDVSVNQNLYALVISGKPSDFDLIKAWQNIHAQYSDQVGNAEHKLYAAVFAEASILAATYKQILILIELLSMCCEAGIFPGDLYKELNRLLHTTFPFSATDMQGNLSNLKRCANRSKGVKMRLDIQQQKLNAMQVPKGDGQPVTKEYFLGILLTLSDHAGYHIDDSITVFEYCERVKRFNKYCEHMKMQNNGRK